MGRKLTTVEVSERTGIASQTLCNWRNIGMYGPPYYKLGGAVRYDEDDVENWMATGRRTSTSQGE